MFVFGWGQREVLGKLHDLLIRHGEELGEHSTADKGPTPFEAPGKGAVSGHRC